MEDTDSPAVWEVCKSKSTGQIFWYNIATEQSTYEMPACLADDANEVDDRVDLKGACTHLPVDIEHTCLGRCPCLAPLLVCCPLRSSTHHAVTDTPPPETAIAI